MTESQAWDISLNGFLEKKRQNLKIWHWRFMNLQNSVLTSYTDETKVTKTGEFYLHANCKVEVLLQGGDENSFIVYESNDIDDAYELVTNDSSSRNGTAEDSNNIENSTGRDSLQAPFILRAKDYADLEIWMLSIIQSINGEYREDENFNKFKESEHVDNENNVYNSEAGDVAAMTDQSVDQLNLLLQSTPNEDASTDSSNDKKDKKKVYFQVPSTPAKLEKVKVELEDPDPLTRFLDRPKSFRNSRRFSFKKGITINETSSDDVTLVDMFSLPPSSSAAPFGSWKQHKIELLNNKLTIYETIDMATLENVANAMSMAPMALAKGITAISSKLSTTLTSSAKNAPLKEKDVATTESVAATPETNVKLVRHLDKFSQVITLPTKYTRQPNTFAILLMDRPARSSLTDSMLTDGNTYFSIRLAAPTETVANKWIETLRREIERQIDLDFICLTNADTAQTSLLAQTTTMIAQPLNLLYTLYNSATTRDSKKVDSSEAAKPVETDRRQRLDSNDLGVGGNELTALLTRSSIRRSIFGVFDAIATAATTSDTDKLLTEKFIHPVSKELLSGADGDVYHCFAVYENQRYDTARGYSSNHLKKEDFAKLTDVMGLIALPFLFLTHVQLPAAFEWLQENQAGGVHHVNNDLELPCDWIPDQEYDHAASIGNWMYADSFAEFSSGSYPDTHKKERPYEIRRRKWIKFCKVKQ
jgi:hypothetical protein